MIRCPCGLRTRAVKASSKPQSSILKEHKKDLSEVREAIAQVVNTDKAADFIVGPLREAKKPLRRSSTGSISSSAVRRALSFGSEPSTPGRPAEPQEKPEQQPPAEQPEQQPPLSSLSSPRPSSLSRISLSSLSLSAISLSSSHPLTSPCRNHKAQRQATSEASSAWREERFRITYEARQLLRNVFADPESPVLGVVGKGLLVVPGQWARLSNISEDGKFIEAEQFKVGSKTILRGAGTSAGRILEAYRKVRKSHPELVEHLEIMSQPAANVDSVILGWVLEAQAKEHVCSLWQRDCFSAVFSDSSTQKMALAQQISCLVAAKCTSMLQITDSDFSKQFKSLVRKELKELRLEFQQRTKGLSVFKVGALEIVQAVVAAQSQMATKNEQDQWVLRAAVRNGILVWRPNPQTGTLERMLEQKWAKKMGLSMGTKRLPARWFQNRLSSGLKDLIRWDYYNPAEDAEKDLEDGPEIEDAFDDDLAAEASNSLSLRVAPQLVESHKRALAADETTA